MSAKRRTVARRPIIGITVPPVASADAGDLGRGMLCAAAVSRARGIPVLVPAVGRPGEAADLVGRIDALVVTGGRRLPPRFFIEHPRPTLGQTDPERYRFERALILSACEREVPVLGICRGMQTLNQALGGTLVRNLALDWPGALKHRQASPASRPTHRIRVAPHSRLSAAVGRRHARVNTFHLQAVETPGAGLEAVAWADDGVIEAIEARRGDPFLVGVQFHPEVLAQKDRRWLGLFRALIAAARRRTA